jgi:hypothetical protein
MILASAYEILILLSEPNLNSHHNYRVINSDTEKLRKESYVTPTLDDNRFGSLPRPVLG